MPEVQKLRIGYSAGSLAHSGVFLAPLIGMDPAANDWLHSPDETGLGDFGVLLMLSSSSHPVNGKQSASQLFCRVIKQLFDQTIDLPQDDQSIIALLEQYFVKAHQQLCDPSNVSLGTEDRLASAALGLIRQEKIYLVWVGNIKWYRYHSKGTTGSYFTEDARWQMLTVDHTDFMENILANADIDQPSSSESFTQQLGQLHSNPICSKRILPVYQGDILICTQDYLQRTVGEAAMLKQFEEGLDAQSLAARLESDLQHSQSSENHAVLVAEIIEAPIHPGFIPKDRNALLEEAIQYYGLPVPVVSVKRENSEKRKLLAFNKPKDKISDNEIEPMGVRTVLPYDDYETASSSDELKVETPMQMPVASNPDDMPTNTETLPDAAVSASESSGSKLRIRLTVYPDPEDTDSVTHLSGTGPENEHPLETLQGDPEQVLSIQNETIDVISDAHENPDLGNEKLPVSDATDESEIMKDDTEENISTISEFDDFFSSPESLDHSDDDNSASQDISSSNEVALVDLNSDNESQHVEHLESVSVEEHVSTEEEIEAESDEIESSNHDEQEDVFGAEVVFPEDQSTEGKTEQSSDFEEEIDLGSDWMQSVKQVISAIPRWIWIGTAAIFIGIIWFLSLDSGNDQLVPAQKKENETTQSTGEPKKPKNTNEQQEEKTVSEAKPKKGETKTIDNPNIPVRKDDKKKIGSIETEPEYDAAIQQNKLQLLDEVNTLWSQKKTLCRKISSYRNNAPTRKQEKLDPLVYDCEQLEEKFSSIYDPKSGYFRTTRYDFLTGTLNNIKVSLNRAENRLDEIRQD
jgi:serine/threonine protein phosphatase PrpC